MKQNATGKVMEAHYQLKITDSIGPIGEEHVNTFQYYAAQNGDLEDILQEVTRSPGNFIVTIPVIANASDYEPLFDLEQISSKI